MPISQTEGYFNDLHRILEEPMLFLLDLKSNL